MLPSNLRAPIKSKGRPRHAPVAEGKQIGQPLVFGLEPDGRDRVGHGAPSRRRGSASGNLPAFACREGIGLIPGESLHECGALLGSDWLRLVHSSLSFRAYDVLGLLSLTFLCLQRALRQIGIDVVRRIILGKVDFTGQLFKKMRPPRVVHDQPFTSDRWKVIPPSFNRWFSDNSTNRIFSPIPGIFLASSWVNMRGHYEKGQRRTLSGRDRHNRSGALFPCLHQRENKHQKGKELLRE